MACVGHLEVVIPRTEVQAKRGSADDVHQCVHRDHGGHLDRRIVPW